MALNNRMRASHGTPQDPLRSLPRSGSLRRDAISGKPDWVSSPSAAGCPAIGPSSSDPTSSCAIAAAAKTFPLKRYHYGLRICPEPVHWGGLSGSPYSEAISWGKFVPPAEGGQFAEVFDDATVALPLVAGAVLERLKKQ